MSSMHVHNFEPNGGCDCGEHIALVPHLAHMTNDYNLTRSLRFLQEWVDDNLGYDCPIVHALAALLDSAQ